MMLYMTNQESQDGNPAPWGYDDFIIMAGSGEDASERDAEDYDSSISNRLGGAEKLEDTLQAIAKLEQYQANVLQGAGVAFDGYETYKQAQYDDIILDIQMLEKEKDNIDDLIDEINADDDDSDLDNLVESAPEKDSRLISNRERLTAIEILLQGLRAREQEIVALSDESLVIHDIDRMKKQVERIIHLQILNDKATRFTLKYNSNTQLN